MDKNTGEITGCAECAQLRLDLELSHKDVIRLRRVEAALRMKMQRDAQEDPMTKDVKEVGAYWKLKIRPNSRVPADGKRADVIRKALKRHSVDELKRAIDGAASDDWVMGRHQQTKSWPKNSLKNDIQHIMGDETLVEKFANIAEEDPAPPIEKVLDRLEDVRETETGQWVALCPSHFDEQHSLTVSQGEKGVLVNCFAGCEFKEIVKALGMKERELFGESNQELMKKSIEPDPLPTNDDILKYHRSLTSRDDLDRLEKSRGWKKETIEALKIGIDGDRFVIPQYAKDKESLENVIRYKPGGKPKTLPVRGRPRMLYPLPIARRSGTVVIFEGEADAILGVQELGDKYAVTSIPGAAAWKDEWATYFGKYETVLILFDCDNAGRTAAQKIAKSVQNVVAEVHILDLDPTKYDGYDFTDFILEGRQLNEVEEVEIEG